MALSHVSPPKNVIKPTLSVYAFGASLYWGRVGERIINTLKFSSRKSRGSSGYMMKGNTG